jgi:hypothetical protein
VVKVKCKIEFLISLLPIKPIRVACRSAVRRSQPPVLLFYNLIRRITHHRPLSPTSPADSSPHHLAETIAPPPESRADHAPRLSSTVSPPPTSRFAGAGHVPGISSAASPPPGPGARHRVAPQGVVADVPPPRGRLPQQPPVRLRVHLQLRRLHADAVASSPVQDEQQQEEWRCCPRPWEQDRLGGCRHCVVRDWLSEISLSSSFFSFLVQSAMALLSLCTGSLLFLDGENREALL